MTLSHTTAYQNGEFLPFQRATLSIASAPVLYGLSVYTVFTVRWDESEQCLMVFRLADHYARLKNSCKIMGFDDSPLGSYQSFRRTCHELLARNTVREDALVRVSVYVDELARGTRMNGLRTGISMYVTSGVPIVPLSGAHLCVSSWRRVSDDAMPARAKVNGNYVNASLMKNEALLGGFDDAIALGSDGHVTESSVANVFLVRDGSLITPGVTSDLLEGITRHTVISLARDAGMPVVERPVDRSELYIADEVFICGSSAGIAPVLSIDRRRIADGSVGPVTKRMAMRYDKVRLGRIKAFSRWTEVALSPVSAL